MGQNLVMAYQCTEQERLGRFLRDCKGGDRDRVNSKILTEQGSKYKYDQEVFF